MKRQWSAHTPTHRSVASLVSGGLAGHVGIAVAIVYLAGCSLAGTNWHEEQWHTLRDCTAGDTERSFDAAGGTVLAVGGAIATLGHIMYTEPDEDEGWNFHFPPNPFGSKAALATGLSSLVVGGVLIGISVAARDANRKCMTVVKSR